MSLETQQPYTLQQKDQSDPLNPKEKYVVIKLSEFEELDSATKGVLLSRLLPDCWVIRKHDQHAPMSVFAYAHSVQSTIEILQCHTAFDAIDLAPLENARDAAFDFAIDSQDLQTKRLPN